MKRKQFFSPFVMIRFSEKSSFKRKLGFTSYWDYNPTKTIHVHNAGVYTSEKVLNLSSTNKIHLKCYVFDGSPVDGLRQPILYSFVLNKLPVYKVFSEPETIHYKKNKSVLITITFYLADDNHEEVDFNQAMLIFTLQIIKI